MIQWLEFVTSLNIVGSIPVDNKFYIIISILLLYIISYRIINTYTFECDVSIQQHKSEHYKIIDVNICPSFLNIAISFIGLIDVFYA